MSHANYVMLVNWIIQDTANTLDHEMRDAAITSAVAIYSRHRPRQVVATLTGTGTATDFAVPTGWEDGLSSILSIEYPVDEQDPVYLDAEDYLIRPNPTTGLSRIQFRSLTLTLGEKAYVTYGIRHTLGPVTDTIPLADRVPVAKLAGAECCEMLSLYYTQTSDATIGADTVNYRTKGDEYAARAKMLRMAFDDALGLTQGLLAASVSADLDVELQNLAGAPFYHTNVDR